MAVEHRAGRESSVKAAIEMSLGKYRRALNPFHRRTYFLVALVVFEWRLQGEHPFVEGYGEVEDPESEDSEEGLEEQQKQEEQPSSSNSPPSTKPWRLSADLRNRYLLGN